VEGEDALQQAFIKAHQALLGGKAPRELRPWLYAIARNCCLSAIAARRGWVGIESLDRTPALEGLSEEVRQREDLRELLSGIGRLPEDQRSALLLAEIDDLSHQAIATILQCPVNRVKALIYQARSALIAERDARNASCQDIREQISVARGGELRRGPLRRHLKLCTGCRDFQLAVSAQRRSLAAVLPVPPSAGLAAAILGHGAGGAGGAGTAATGSAAATTGAGLVPAGSTSAGALLGGAVTKLAATGAIVALAAGGTVTVHNQLAHATPQRTAHALANHRLLASLSPVEHRNVIAAIVSPSSVQAESPAGLTIPSAARPLLTAATAPAPSFVLPAISAPPGTNYLSENSSEKSRSFRIVLKAPLANAHAKHRRAARHLRHRRHLRRARRHRRAIHRRARLRKALLHPPVAKPQPPQPAVTPVPARTPHRKGRLVPLTGTEKTASGIGASEKTGPRKMGGPGSGKAGSGTESTPRKTKTTEPG
jgi:RNA polymerase sigma factor (sigma-70 family)